MRWNDLQGRELKSTGVCGNDLNLGSLRAGLCRLPNNKSPFSACPLSARTSLIDRAGRSVRS
jgi:hypothetical protein